MNSRNPTQPTKEDVLAILKAHRDLGPEFDSHLADQILDLWHGRGAKPPRMRAGGDSSRSGNRVGIHRALPFLAISVALLAIAGGIDGGTGVLAVLGLDALVVILTSVFS